MMSKGIFQLAVTGRVLFRWSPETNLIYGIWIA